MGSQHSTVNRTQSLDVPRSTSQTISNGNEPGSTSAVVSGTRMVSSGYSLYCDSEVEF